MIIADYSTFMISHNFKASASGRCVCCVATLIIKDIDIFKY